MTLASCPRHQAAGAAPEHASLLSGPAFEAGVRLARLRKGQRLCLDAYVQRVGCTPLPPPRRC